MNDEVEFDLSGRKLPPFLESIRDPILASEQAGKESSACPICASGRMELAEEEYVLHPERTLRGPMWLQAVKSPYLVNAEVAR